MKRSRKYPCPDCRMCQMCSDLRCEMCLGPELKARYDRRLQRDAGRRCPKRTGACAKAPSATARKTR